MKIQATNKNVKSMKLVVPFDGIIEIDAEGVANVSEKCAEQLVKNTNDWKYIVPVKEESIDEDANGEELTKEKLMSLKVNDLRAMCAEAGWDEAEYKDLKKEELAEYILEKMDEEPLDEDANGEE